MLCCAPPWLEGLFGNGLELKATGPSVVVAGLAVAELFIRSLCSVTRFEFVCENLGAEPDARDGLAFQRRQINIKPHVVKVSEHSPD